MSDDTAADEPELGSPEQRLREARKQARIARDDLTPNTPAWHMAQATVEHAEEAMQALDGGPVPDGEDLRSDGGTMDASAEAVDRLEVTYQPPAGPRRRVRFEPRAADGGMWRYTDVWTGCRWRQEGCEPVDMIDVERGGEVIR
ncbi:hypothetical protein [Haloarcula pellucida]|uniref:Uncharacterized protein n=1 Tax=Haloarcula pellucida TaxID=1427151 RepID=A0A830GSZ3_9EURY|nr:hypothetical protein [Halomicroarcula pellucida]MBX0350529.1 hypothetical protein [Halomicroarcula pellucida]GGO03747.1 hypothetical protein GCM10009030_39740 [Halomicroarcula pellucida]